MLRPFFEAYEIVADVLRDAPAEIAEKELTKLALGVGRQYVAQDRVRSNESVSALLFATARQVIADQHLLECRPPTSRAPRGLPARASRRSCATWTRSSASRASSSSPARWSGAAAQSRVAQRGRLSDPPREAIRWAHDAPAASPPSVRSAPVWPVLRRRGGAGGLTAAAASAALSLADALTATGLPDPGPVTTYGLPFVRAAGEIAAVVAVGSFLFAAFLVPPQDNGVLDAAGYRALRIGHRRLGRRGRCARRCWCR